MRGFLILIFAILFPALAMAQSAAELSQQIDDDKGFLTRFLEKNLSGDDRRVVISGFEGALSSRATFDEIVIMDADGAWLTLKNGAIQWSRTALLRRRVQIAELSAEVVELPRLPTGEAQDTTAETTEFALPDLPVSLEIEKIQVGRVELGEPVIGMPAAIAVNGNMSLIDGEGMADLTIDRLDGPRGEFILSAAYGNETQNLSVNLALEEARDGLLVNLIDLHDKPSVSAQISGEGTLDDFAADLRLATAGQPRVTGRVTLNQQELDGQSPGRGFRVQLGGDVAALLPPDDRTFFGPNTQLLAEGWRGQDGRLNIPTLRIDTDALNLEGQLSTNASNAPQTAQLTITLGRDAGASQVPVSLPGAGQNATVESGRVELNYDADQGRGWTLQGRVGMLNQGTVSMEELTLNGAGEVLLSDTGALSEITGGLDFGASGLNFADPALARAVGQAVTGRSTFTYGGGHMDISELQIDGADYGLNGYALLSGLSTGIIASFDMTAGYQDLSRISDLAGRSLAGQAQADLSGYYTVLTKSFDLDAEIRGTDISIDQEQADRLLAGQSRIKMRARRDEVGIELGQLTVNAQNLTAEAQGYLNSDSSDLTARISMPSLSEVDPGYSGSAELLAKLSGATGARQLAVSGDAEDLQIGIEALDGALQGKTTLTVLAGEQEDGYALKAFELSNPQLSAEGQGSFAQGALDGTANLSVPDLAAIKAGWSGGFSADAVMSESQGTRLFDVTGTGQNLSLGQQNVDGALTGTTDLTIKAQEKDGVITLRDVSLTNQQMNVTADGTYGPGVTDLTADIDIASLASFGAGWRGALSADASFQEQGEGVRRLQLTGTGQDLAMGQAQLDGALAGETRIAVTGTEQGGVFTIEQAQIENPRLSADASGKVGGGQTDLSARLNASDLRFVGNGIRGSVSADARLVEDGDQRRITATGNANGLQLNQPRIDPVLRGQTSFDIAATQSPSGLSLQRLQVQNPQLRVSADGDPAQALNIDARLSDLGLIERAVPGPVQVTGTLAQTPQNFVIDLDATGPAQTRLQIAGTAARDFSTTDIAITGGANAAIANSFMRTRSIDGPLSLDLRLNGAPGLNALTGTAQLTGAELADPRLGIRLDDLTATAGFQNGRINVDATSSVAAGGRLSIAGPVDLRAGTLDLVATLDNVVARDPNLYQTRLSGQVRVSGRNADGPLISGRIDVGETEIRIPSTGLGGAKAIPDISHLAERPPQRATRAKAGLLPYPSDASRDANMSAPPSTPPGNPPRLDLFISAPNQVFIRGRGVDAEMGGELQVRGTARNVVPIGHLELIRGRVDLLGKRFDLTEGLVELQGSLVPVLRLVAETSQNDVTTRVIIDGEARDPDVSFESSPEMPEEEVLSQLLFGRGLDTISPLQALQLANALAVLAGRGGEGVIGNLRNQFGLDDLDLQTDDEGNVEVRAGKYISDNVYTDVSVGDQGKTSINLNLDISETLRARGSVASDGESTLGVYFERDY